MNENKKEPFVNSKLFFWIRFGLYALFMFIIPAAFLFVKFKLFQKITAFQIGGWGVVFILIVGFGMIKLVKEVKRGLPFCYATQVLNGTLKVLLPLTLCTLILYVMQDNVKDVLIMMYILIPCELVAILVNPLPRWAYDNKLGEEGYKMKTVLESAGLFDFFKKQDKGQ